MFEHFYIQEQGTKQFCHEASLISNELLACGYEIKTYTLKRIRRRQLPLNQYSFVFGDWFCMAGVLKQLKIPYQPFDNYPSSLAPYLHRRIWRSTLDKVRKRMAGGFCGSTFIKPAKRAKLFTGFVVDSESDFYNTFGASKREPVYCSEIVSWLSEYRIYIMDSTILAVDLYKGDPAVKLDLSVVQKAIADFGISKSPCAYSLDFGVLSTGLTALVEVNDALSLGAYQICGQDYTNMMLYRWQEILTVY